MFYTVASPDWKPGQPLTSSAALLFRTRSEAETFAPEALTVALAVRFDASRSLVRSQQRGGDLTTPGGWSVPAVGNALGGVTVFGSIPASLIRPSFDQDADPAWRSETQEDASRSPGRTGFNGWDSLTMALLA